MFKQSFHRYMQPFGRFIAVSMLIYVSCFLLVPIVMDVLFDQLSSFMNTYRAVMYRLRDAPQDNKQLGQLVGIHSSTARSRRGKPDLWRLSELSLLAKHFDLAVSSFDRLADTLGSLSAKERQQLGKLLHYDTDRMIGAERSGWPAGTLVYMHHCLKNALIEDANQTAPTA
jgi:hypothetical protein